MFEDSMVESGGKIRTKKGSTVFVSAIVHVVLVLVLIVVPLIFTEQIEGARLTSFLVAPPPPPPAAPQAERAMLAITSTESKAKKRLFIFLTPPK
jgi:protein TonB